MEPDTWGRAGVPSLTGAVPLMLALGLLALCGNAATADDAGAKSLEVLPSVTARVTDTALKRPADVPDDAALVAAGARIGTIRMRRVPVFDTQRPEEDTRLFRLANRLHIETREATVADQLLFRSGDVYDPRVLEETARILRRARYLREAQVLPVAFKDGRVDVEVLTQDVWTLNPGVSFGRKGGTNTSGFQLEELNLLGLGTQLSLGYNKGVDRTSSDLIYRDRHLGRSWWQLDAQYSDNSDGRRAELALDHPFYALQTKAAGGVFLRDDDRIDSRYDLGEVIGKYRTRERGATVYYGRSPGLVDGNVHRWTVGFTRDERHFDTLRDPLSVRIAPPDRTLAYPWIGYEWIEDQFRTARNRDLIERTEDISLGWQASARMGVSASAFGGDRTAVVFNGRVSRGLEPTPEQTWLFEGGLLGRHESGKFTDTIISGAARYYRRQSARRLFFAAFSFDAGRNLDLDRQLLVGGDNGLRGYPLRYQAGEGRWLFTVEQRAFTDWYPFRLFNVGGAAFLDVGRTWGDRPFGSRSQGLLKDIGVGLRLGNARSALGNVLHIDVAVPLDGDSSIKNVQFLVETKRTY